MSKYDDQRITRRVKEKEPILKALKEQGFRITRQRKLIINIILEHECSCCKEIYYRAIKEDPTIGIATVYRMIKALEEIQAIDRRNLYRIAYREEEKKEIEWILVLKDEQQVRLSQEELKTAFNDILKNRGYSDDRVNSLIIGEYELTMEQVV